MECGMNEIQSRMYADPLDRPVQSLDNDHTHGVGRDSDAIGGFRGIGWYEYFRDRQTGLLYRVHCSDGVNGGKSAHADNDLKWILDSREKILRRTRNEAASGVEFIELSSNEWALMLGRIHSDWLDLKAGQTHADGDRAKDEGLIGHIRGIPVMVNPKKEDRLPLR